MHPALINAGKRSGEAAVLGIGADSRHCADVPNALRLVPLFARAESGHGATKKKLSSLARSLNIKKDKKQLYNRGEQKCNLGLTISRFPGRI